MSLRHKIGSTINWVTSKAFGLSQYAQMWLAGQDTTSNLSSKATRPYKQVSLVFTCVEKLISAVQGIPLVLSTIDEKIVESGPQYDLLFNNPAMTWRQFVTQTIGHYSLTRDVFWIFLSDGTNPMEIMVVSGPQMHPITHDRTAAGVLIGWEFRGQGGQRAKFTTEEVHQWKNFNPYDQFHGLGPATACELDIDYSFAAALHNSSALANGAELGTVLVAPGKMEPDQIQLIRSQFDARHRGAAQARRTALLTGGLDVKSVAKSMVDMQVAKITEMSDKRIASSFGLPPGVAGLITDSQYSHGPAQRDFIFNTVTPLVTMFAGEITAGILPRFTTAKWLGGSVKAVEPCNTEFFSGRKNLPLSRNKFYRLSKTLAVAGSQKIFAWFDIGQHPTVQEYDEETAEKVLKFTDAGVPLNDIVEAYDLPFKPTKWGKHWWVPMGLVPAEYTLAAGIEGLTGPSLPEGGEPQETPEDDKLSGAFSLAKEWIAETKQGQLDFKQRLKENDAQQKADDAQRLRIWRNWVISWAGIEREYKEAMRFFFVRQQRILIGKLKTALGELKAVEKTNPEDVIARVVFDLKIENGKLKVINDTFFDKASELGIRQSVSEVTGLKGDELAEATDQVKHRNLVRTSLVRSSHKITKVNATTQNKVAEQLRKGLASGEGIGKLTDRIKTTLGSSRGRALSIARTQTAGAVSTGRHAGFKHSGVKKKSWLTSRDDNVRDSHKQAEVTYAKGIPLDQPFEIGSDYLMYPGDPSGSAAEIINCRCAELAVVTAGKTFDLTYYSNLKFYSYSDMEKDIANGPVN